jgi:hypothetical protein
MKFAINFDGLQTADDGNTTHYGGVVKVNDVEVPATGTDREFNMPLDVVQEIGRQLGRELTADEVDAFAESDDFSSYTNHDVEFPVEFPA